MFYVDDTRIKRSIRFEKGKSVNGGYKSVNGKVVNEKQKDFRNFCSNTSYRQIQ